MELWNWKAITVINGNERRNEVHTDCMKRGFKLIEKGLFKAKDLITHTFSLEEIDKAFQTMHDKPDDYIKAVIKI